MNEIPVYQALESSDLSRLSEDIAAAYKRASEHEAEPEREQSQEGVGVEMAEEDAPEYQESSEVPKLESLIGIDLGVYRQINAALKAGKRHLMFYGPPGTGKTTLAQHCASSLAGSNITMITGSADWTSQDVIGGYQPIGNGQIKFIPGVLLRNFHKPLIIDELNRCDIDKVLGPLFTVLSGHQSTLPHRVHVEDADSEQITILPNPNARARKGVEFAPGTSWRIIATINSVDKASLFQMSYALMRRFAWIYIDVPTDLDGFIRTYLDRKKISGDASDTSPLALVWSHVNTVRPVGPAPVIDMIDSMLAMDDTIDLLGPVTSTAGEAYVSAVELYLLPMLDGIFREESTQLAQQIAAVLNVSMDSTLGSRLSRRLTAVSA